MFNQIINILLTIILNNEKSLIQQNIMIIFIH